MPCRLRFLSFFFFNDTATTEIYTLSLHDALPILKIERDGWGVPFVTGDDRESAEYGVGYASAQDRLRSEEHTSELQSPCNLVCRLLLEKKKQNDYTHTTAAATHSATAALVRTRSS